MRVECWIPKLSHMSGRPAAASETGWIRQRGGSLAHRPSHKNKSASAPKLLKAASPVMGASTSSMHFSWRRMAAPSLMILSAASSSSRPSFTRWALRTSTLGLPSTYKSLTNSRVLGGCGTAAEKGQVTNGHQHDKTHKLLKKRKAAGIYI